MAFTHSRPDVGSPKLPPPPRPSADVGMSSNEHARIDEKSIEDEVDDDTTDIWTMNPITALKMLCASVEELVLITGDVPPTPPISRPGTPTQSSGMMDHMDKENKCFPGISNGEPESRFYSRKFSDGQREPDGTPVKKTPIGSPETHPHEPSTLLHDHPDPSYVQHGAIARKFYSKRPPPISLEEYLLRLHRYCPMSTAVYLATAVYIHRLAITERIIPVTTRNCHRLVLAALRTAMKALEDLSYAHHRFSKVGGVSEIELGRLEISFCFLTNFDLMVGEEMLTRQAMMMKDGWKFRTLPSSSWNLSMGKLAQKVG
ncbi:hypothetical protein MMC25_001014 [Agyrium rufum]|nr:hypothetical protein [Agyrium rufum]